MLDIITACIGIFLAVLTIIISRKLRLESWIYATTLASLPLIYVGFAILGNSTTAAFLELLYGIPFFMVCILLLKSKTKSIIYLAGLTWFLHGGYDLIHNAFFTNPGVWKWYPVFCTAYDFTVGIYLIITARKLTNMADNSGFKAAH